MNRRKVRSESEKEYEREKLQLLGRAIRKTLKGYHITQTELAKQINWDRGNLTSALHGRKPIPAVKLDQILFCLPDSLRENLYEELETLKENYFGTLREEIKEISTRKNMRYKKRNRKKTEEKPVKRKRSNHARVRTYTLSSQGFDDFID